MYAYKYVYMYIYMCICIYIYKCVCFQRMNHRTKAATNMQTKLLSAQLHESNTGTFVRASLNFVYLTPQTGM